MAEKPVFAAPELPAELIRQYKEALGGLSDIRLVVLLLFNAFEEVMKAFACWRLTCTADDLPRLLSNNPSSLFQVVLVGNLAEELRKRTKAFSELRNAVAHGFHRNDYERQLSSFIAMILKKPSPTQPAETRRALIESVFSLTLDIATYVDDTPSRGEWPFPMLALELAQ